MWSRRWADEGGVVRLCISAAEQGADGTLPPKLLCGHSFTARCTADSHPDSTSQHPNRTAWHSRGTSTRAAATCGLRGS